MTCNWIIPCNVKYFDVINHFKASQTVVWKNISSAKVGDIVYIYLGSPFCEIRYKCIVISDTVSEETLQENKYAIPRRPQSELYLVELKYIELQLVEEYPSGVLELHKLKDHGLGQVQVQAKTNDKLQRYIDETTSSLLFEN